MTVKPKGVFNLIEELEEFYKEEEIRHDKLFNYELSQENPNTIKAQIQKALAGKCFLTQNRLRELRQRIATEGYKSKVFNPKF